MQINELAEVKKEVAEKASTIERTAKSLEDENKRLREENDRLRDELRFLRTEVCYVMHMWLILACCIAQPDLFATLMILHLWGLGVLPIMMYGAVVLCVVDGSQGPQRLLQAGTQHLR